LGKVPKPANSRQDSLKPYSICSSSKSPPRERRINF